MASWLSTAAELLLLISVLTGGLLGGGLGGFVAALIGEGASVQEFASAGAAAGTGLVAFGCVLLGQFFVLATPAIPFVMEYAPRSAPPVREKAVKRPPVSPLTGHVEAAPPKKGEHIPTYLTEEDSAKSSAAPQKEHIPAYLSEEDVLLSAPAATASAAMPSATLPSATVAPATVAPATMPSAATEAPAPTVTSFFGASAWMEEGPTQISHMVAPPTVAPPAQVHANAMTLDIDLDFDLDGLQAPSSDKPL
ncbi:MAG: hypothetical protein ACKO6N_10365 [Myxococcota bacterium]